MTNTKTTNHSGRKFAVGDRVRFNDHTSAGTVPAPFTAGEVTVVTKVRGAMLVDVENKHNDDDPTRTFNVEWFEVEPVGLKITDPVTTERQWSALPVGAKVRDSDGWIHTKVRDYAEGRPSSTYVAPNGGTGTFNRPWQFDAVLVSLPGSESGPEPEPVEPEPVATSERPTIDFGADRWRTAREYAAAMQSTILDDKHNGVLTDVANGYVVDVLALNDALFHALRSGLTRFGASPTRRDFGRKVAHLHHATQAVLTNAVDGLPAYEQGVRSRRIETLEGEVAALKTAGEAALKSGEEALAMLDEERAARASTAAEVNRLLARLNEQDQKLQEAEAGRTAYARTLDYLLNENADHPFVVEEGLRERALGYLTALQDHGA